MTKFAIYYVPEAEDPFTQEHAEANWQIYREFYHA